MKKIAVLGTGNIAQTVAVDLKSNEIGRAHV